MYVKFSLFAIGAAIAIVTPAESPLANPISVDTATLNIFRTVDAQNDVHVAQGDNFQFGADINGGSLGTSLAAIFTPTGSATPTFMTSFRACGPLEVNANFCAATTPFSIAQTNGSWQVEFQNGTNTTTLALPSVMVIPANPVPFPSNVTIAANGVTPTISWTLPAGTNPNAYRVNIYDKSQFAVNGENQVIFSSNLNPTATSFTIPVNAGLVVGGNYAIEFQVINTRDGQPLPANSNLENENILTRSRSSFDFSPPGGGAPPVIQLPTISPNGVYHFNVGSVGPNSVTFIDPTVAVGYVYDTGLGDPNFASVLLPDVGGGHFDLSYLLNGAEFSTMLDAGIQYFFPTGGVSEFEVTGIDPAAGIDPTNALAFVTGLTFASNGPFTGTMTPITAQVATVPEPSTIGLFGLPLAAFYFLRRRVLTRLVALGPLFRNAAEGATSPLGLVGAG
jgi:hypothetical protein